MKRRTLDIIFASGGMVIALAMLLLGFVLMDQYNWGQDYVKEELGSQKIYFTAADKLTDEEKNWQPGSSCLVENGGKLTRPEVRLRVQEALERRGVEFTNGDAPGFRLHSVPIVPARC